MHIGIDARMFGTLQGGLGRHVQKLIEEIVLQKTQDSFTIFLRDDAYDLIPDLPHIQKVHANIPWYGLAEQTTFLKILKQHPVDLMHFPHWNIPLLYNDPFIVTIHDLLLMHYPSKQATLLGPLLFKIKYAAYKQALAHAVQKSKKIITTSQYTKKDIIDTLSVSPEKIEVVYQAPGMTCSKTDDHIIETRKKLDTKFGIEKPYFLYVGVAYPHKNLDFLLTAWEKFFAESRGTYQIVLAGKSNYFYEQLHKRVRRMPSRDLRASIVFTDYVLDDELCDLYYAAKAFVFPSLYEGFGIPALEAMAASIPVISSNATCMPEVLGNAAIYFDPKNPDDLCNKMREVSNYSTEMWSYVAKGHEQVGKYSWEKFGVETYTVYKKYSV